MDLNESSKGPWGLSFDLAGGLQGPWGLILKADLAKLSKRASWESSDLLESLWEFQSLKVLV